MIRNQAAIDFLEGRYSCGKLTSPAPSAQEIEHMLTVAMRAPDHGGLKPAHFVVIQGGGLDRLSELFVEAMTNAGADEAKLAKAEKMPYRAPLIIAVIARYKEHPKVPRIEQIQTAGCATLSLQQMAMAYGYNGIWRTGDIVNSPIVRQAFDLAEQDELVGFLYLGTEEGNGLCRKPPVIEKNVSYWS
ncbi:NAD(P)H nitroreductase [Psychrobium sp. MM17-31]|uniref:NAD(P)H nitroreductase n=1 Tax=Psychrobium sp. MM17-31 TaxID=2917758 RepID=UPI001EF3E0F6|nr:NAD(P)H nitroreductase [Psychrobium sp. MM17-31]MCG7531556.1 NAD(P)H nitroreductase [Psychrobium sp. MM17-31]